MKKITLFILTTFLSLSLLANYGNTRLVVSTSTTQDYLLLIDGYTVGNQYKTGNSYTISDISSANHRIQLYRQSSSIFGGNNRKLVYDNNIYLKPNTETTLRVNLFGKVVIEEQPLNNGGWNGDNGSWNGNNGEWNGNNNGNNNGNWNSNGCSNHSGHNCEGKKGKGHKKHKHCKKHNSWNDNRNDNGRWRNEDSRDDFRSMNDRTFMQLKQSIQNEHFDDTKQTIAMQAIQDNYLSAAQVKEVVGLFSFESSKLAIAKYSYNRTVDKERFFLVNDAFTFSISKEALMQYIRSVG